MIADLFTKIVSGIQDTRLSVRFYSIMPDSSGLVLGTSSPDPTSFDSRASVFLYPGALEWYVGIIIDLELRWLKNEEKNGEKNGE